MLNAHRSRAIQSTVFARAVLAVFDEEAASALIRDVANDPREAMEAMITAWKRSGH
jgi:hypothetical protein